MDHQATSQDGPNSQQHDELSVGQMTLANRPWRLVRDLSKVLVATLASAGFFIVNANAWTIADQISVARHLIITVLAVGGLGVWLVIAHGLWERPASSDDPTAIRRVNTATALTLLLGLLFAFCVLWVSVLLAMVLVVPEGFAATNLKHSADAEDYIVAAWFAASMATVVGAIGSGLESDDEVHDTITRYRADVPSEDGPGQPTAPTATSRSA